MPETKTNRLFVAIFPLAHIVKLLQGVAANLAKALPGRTIRWTPPEKLHLTLNFLGEIEIARVPEIQSALKAACDGHWQHRLRLKGLGVFPNHRRPRIIWAGLIGNLRPLEDLKKSIDARLAACGCVGEERPFHPHLTIGRAAELNPVECRRVAKALDEEKDRDFGEWQVERIDLMRSVLSPQGATYDTLGSVRLS